MNVSVAKFLFGGDDRTLGKLLVFSLRASWTVNAVPHWRTSSWKIGFLFLLDWILLSILNLHPRNLTSRNMMVFKTIFVSFWKAFKERKIVKFRVCVCIIQYSQALFGQPGLHNKAPGGKSTWLSCSCRGTFRSYFATWKNEFTWSWQVLFFFV